MRVLKVVGYVLGVIALASVAMFVVGLVIAPRTTPDRTTIGRMWGIKERFVSQVTAVGVVPKGIEGLPMLEHVDNGTNDGWGRPIHCAVDKEHATVSLQSLGADGKPGGEGADSDIVRRFALRGEDGNWMKPRAAFLDDE
jgi:hypothetical protein